MVALGKEHLLQTLDFTDGNVPQLINGNGGTELTGAPAIPQSGTTPINDRTVNNTYIRDNWGFMAATPSTTGWTMQVMSEKGNLKATCAVTASSFVCTSN